MERNYYCLVAGLPDITIDDTKLSVSQQDFKKELKEELHGDDFELVKLFFYPYDNQNLINIIQKKDAQFITKGNFSDQFLEEEIKEPISLPSYLSEFIQNYKAEEPIIKNLSWENQLTWMFHEYILQTENQFLKEWFQTELNIKNLLIGLNCRKHGLKADKELIGDNEFNHSILKKNIRDFGLGKEYPYVDKIVSDFENADILTREKNIDIYKWQLLDELTFFNYFTVEKIIGFLIKLGMVERWLELDEKTGREFFTKLVEDLQSSYQFSEEYNLR